jgi:hypothetical protein
MYILDYGVIIGFLVVCVMLFYIQEIVKNAVVLPMKEVNMGVVGVLQKGVQVRLSLSLSLCFLPLLLLLLLLFLPVCLTQLTKRGVLQNPADMDSAMELMAIMGVEIPKPEEMVRQFIGISPEDMEKEGTAAIKAQMEQFTSMLTGAENIAGMYRAP